MKESLSQIVMLSCLLLLVSCVTTIENEEHLKKLYVDARIHNWMGNKQEALKLYDSLQTAVRHEIYSKRHTKRDFVRLSELWSRTWLEMGKILREDGYYEPALKLFGRAITSNLEYDYDIHHIAWDPGVEAQMEEATTYRMMGDTAEVENYMKRFNKILTIPAEKWYSFK